MSIPVRTPLVVDFDDLRQIGYAKQQEFDPGWVPNEADPGKRLIDAFAAMLAEVLPAAGDIPDDIIRWVGTVIYRTAPFAATPATATSTWTMVDTAGHTVPAGAQVSMVDDAGVAHAFEVLTDVIVAPGASVTATGGVALQAVETGTDSNGLTNPVTLLSRQSFVASITVVAPTAGGTDAETTESYTARIVQLAQILKPTPILPAQFAAVVRLLVPGVARTVAVDLYNADTATSGVERCVTVFGIDSAGANLSGPVKTAAAALLASMREATFLSFVADPTRTAVAVNFTGIAAAGFDPADVQAAAIAAVQALLSPGLWGLSPAGDASVWTNTLVVRFQDVVTALNNVPGFDHYTALTLNAGTADVTLAGPVGLPNATVTGTVT